MKNQVFFAKMKDFWYNKINLIHYYNYMPESIYNLEIFKGIEKEVIKNIVSSCPIKSFETWEMILMEWEESNDEWYIIKSWSVRVSIGWNKVVDLSSGNIFWEIALLNEETRTATVVALWEVTAIVLSLENLIEMINNDDNSINKEIVRRMEENLER